MEIWSLGWGWANSSWPPTAYSETRLSSHVLSPVAHAPRALKGGAFCWPLSQRTRGSAPSPEISSSVPLLGFTSPITYYPVALLLKCWGQTVLPVTNETPGFYSDRDRASILEITFLTRPPFSFVSLQAMRYLGKLKMLSLLLPTLRFGCRGRQH